MVNSLPYLANIYLQLSEFLPADEIQKLNFGQ